MMNWKEIEGKWDTVKARARQRWGKLTDDDLTQIRGRRDELVARLKTRYASEREDVERQVDEWMRSIDKREPR